MAKNIYTSRDCNVVLPLPVASGLASGDIALLGTAGLAGLLHTDRATTALIAAGTSAHGLLDTEASVELLGIGTVVILEIDAAITQFAKVYTDGAGVYSANPIGNKFIGYALQTLSGTGECKVALVDRKAGQRTETYRMLANASQADQCFFIAPGPMRVVRIDEVHSVAGDNGGAVNLQVTKDHTTDAPGAGTNLLTNNTNAGFDLKGTANTVQNGALSATPADLILAAGDRLGVDFAGTLSTLAGVVVTVTLEDL